jgi:hypothetical protein
MLILDGKAFSTWEKENRKGKKNAKSRGDGTEKSLLNLSSDGTAGRRNTR